MVKVVSEIVQTRISKVFLRDDGILQIDIASNHHFDSQDFIDLVDAAYKIGGGKKFRNLIVVGEHTIPDRDARILSSSEKGSRLKIADAFVINSLPQALVANLIMRIHKPFAPTKFFKNVNEAEEWLMQIKE